MRPYLLILSFIFLSISFSSAQKPECKKWKNGEFYMLTKEGDRIEIVRQGNKQVEYDVKTGTKMPLKVKWLNTCTYQLLPWKKTKGDNLIITVTIVETHENYCMIDVKSNLFDMNMREPFYRKVK